MTNWVHKNLKRNLNFAMKNENFDWLSFKGSEYSKNLKGSDVQ